MLDAFIASKYDCVGMTANIISAHKQIIVFDNEGACMKIFTSEIIKNQDCIIRKKVVLLLGAPRKSKRYHGIKLQ